ncbi:hypothetical protein [Parabacteroides sp.]
MRKHRTSLFLLGLLLLTAVAGCRREPANRNDIEAWMAEDPDSCMWYHADSYVPLFKQQKYDSLEHVYTRILRAMPEHPRNPDKLAYIAGWIVTFYFNTIVKQNKIQDCARFTDSLAASPNPFYAHTLQPELLATTAKFYIEEKRMDKVDSIGSLFTRLSPTSNPLRDIRAWHDMAWALEQCDVNIDRVIPLQEYATRLFREGKRGNGDWEVLSQMGHLYLKNGDLEKASELIQEAIGWYIAYPETAGDGLLQAYMDLSNLYCQIGLPDKALETNALAIRESRKMDNWLLENTYRMRAKCFSLSGKPDSALFWIQEAERVTPQEINDLFLPSLQAEKVRYYMTCYPDSVGEQLDECQQLLADTSRLDADTRSNILSYYGIALTQTPGREKEGIDCMERAFHNYLSANRPDGIVHVGERLIKAYVQTGLTERITHIYPVYTHMRDSLQRETTLRSAIGANIRYETGRKEQENKLLEAEVQTKKQVLAYSLTIAGLLIVLSVTTGLYYRQRQRYHRRISEARLSRISSLLDAQQELDKRNNLLTQELQEVSERKAVSDMRSKISTSILNPGEEANFRRSFTALHPDYLPELHRLAPDLTRTDELIAMLLLLGLGNDEIALTLGITKASVNKARSRMRKRLGLDTSMVLEEYLRKLL